MAYVNARYKQYIDDMTYRIYITDSFRAFTKAEDRYIDYIHPKKKDNRSGSEIIRSIKSKLKTEKG